jgi:hypothetical protein
MLRIIRPHIIPVVVVALCASSSLAAGQAAKTVSPEDTREANLRAYVDLLRSDVRSQRIAILTEVMQFTEEEDAKFWPVYREYESELAKINDERIAVIREYASNYDTLTDTVADRLARSALELEGRRNQLKAKYYDRFRTVLPAKTAIRFFQVENQILLLLDLQIAASLPIVQ